MSGYPVDARAVVPPSRETRPAEPPHAAAGARRDRGRRARSSPTRASAGASSLEALREAIGDCQRCKLAPHRTNLVFGVGNPQRPSGVRRRRRPGATRTRRASRSSDAPGQLLTEIITKGMRLRREDVYIANVIKCRPPDNRNPEPDEVASCEPFLVRQLELIRPEVIVALGKFAAQTLLRSKTPITQLRGRWFDYHGIRLMPTFHPAYLLRNPGDKRLVWQDIQQVMQVLGLPGART